MRYKLLGNSGLRVSELCLGTMTFGEVWGWGASKDDSRAMFDVYAEAGGNFIDTANRYTEGLAEEYVGEFIAADRDHFVLSTKYTLMTREGDPNAAGNHRKNMVRSLEASLKRLRTDYIDVYWLHAWDYLTPVEEVMRALDDLVRAGKILYVGVSDTPAWIISRANMLAELRGWSPFIGVQLEYSLVERTPERELLPMAKALDLAALAFSPLAGGALSGKYSRDGLRRSGRLGEIPERTLVIAETVARVAKESGQTPAQVALNWVRQQPWGVVIPIIGGRSADQIRENLDALKHGLSPEALATLDEVSRVDLGFPHQFLAGRGVQHIVYGGTRHLIDDHRQR
ncbi:MAG: aldo/keto reductase [Chloroflexota bacterium]|nr:MAG: aldo/keto reductase [Chloroflexota bacterium]